MEPVGRETIAITIALRLMLSTGDIYIALFLFNKTLN